jgi:hypothetical protein
MRKPIGKRVWWWTLGIAAWVAVSVLSLGLILFLHWYRQSTDYPGALLRADDTIYKLSPTLSIRRDSTYLSGDRFNVVFNWYSSGFNLGPESYAQSGCALMARSFSDFNFIERQMSVMVCDTPKGRLIFVMRSMALKWR